LDASEAGANLYDGIRIRDSSKWLVQGNYIFATRGKQRYAIKEEGTSDYNIIIENMNLSGMVTGRISTVGANTIVKRNQDYVTENSGIATITGDGTTTTFTVDVTHGLVSDKLSAKVACKKPATYKWYLVDADADGTYETLRIEITFDTAPASGETVEIYWEANVV